MIYAIQYGNIHGTNKVFGFKSIISHFAVSENKRTYLLINDLILKQN